MLILVTGSNGFIGRHLVEALSRRPAVELLGYDVGSPDGLLERGLREASVIFHLAGVNRPTDPAEFQSGNVGFTEHLCQRLREVRSGTSPAAAPILVLSSSIQAALDNPYGTSKRQAEETVARWVADGGGRGLVFRLQNVFGKWCRPNYNSVTATFCHNIAHDLPITISDPSRELELVYIDDVVAGLLAVLDVQAEPGVQRSESGDSETACRASAEAQPKAPMARCEFHTVRRSFKTTLGELAARIRSFRDSRQTLQLPDFSDDFNRCLYATYLSYLDGAEFAYGLSLKTDGRGSLAEFVKAPAFGQIFVSRTKPGVTRGNHYHHTKTEKFLVVEGEAIIRFRHVCGGEVIEHRVNGREFRVVDIPPGYTHSIENVGTGEVVTLFWASEVFDPQRPDTYAMPVV